MIITLYPDFWAVISIPLIKEERKGWVTVGIKTPMVLVLLPRNPAAKVLGT